MGDGAKGAENDSPGQKSDEELKAESERAHQIEVYKELHDGAEPDEDWPTDEISARNTTKQNEKSNLSNADPNAAEFAKVFNDYVRLTGQRPFSGWGLDDLKREYDKEVKEREEKAKDADKPAPVNVPIVGDGQIRLRHKENKREITVTKQTYEKFIKKSQPEWVRVAEVPKEIQ